jgi:hypothetical protein
MNSQRECRRQKSRDHGLSAVPKRARGAVLIPAPARHRTPWLRPPRLPQANYQVRVPLPRFSRLAARAPA